MNFKKVIPIVISVAVLISVVSVSAGMSAKAPSINANADQTQPYNLHSSTSDTATTDTPARKVNNDEMRGVWVSYMELDMENEDDKSEISFRKKFENIADTSLSCGFNTLIVQVRPFCDALYQSSYFPWSHILTGTQGKDPEYDALKIMCEICRSKGLKIHAWVNPYRIMSSQTPHNFADDNPYQKNKSIGIKTDNGIYLDPSSEEARQLIINGAEEIVKNYDVDGLQFDDYFYPTQDESFDSDQYKSYVETMGQNNIMSLDNWRTANVNMLVSETYRAVHKANSKAVFGISPQGNISNNDNLYADVKSWCNCRGFIDYICPQIYFSTDNPALTFNDSLDSWTSLSYDSNVSLYVGIAGYKAGTNKDDGTWAESDRILADEYNIIKDTHTVKGIMLYSYASLESSDSKKEIENLKNELN